MLYAAAYLAFRDDAINGAGKVTAPPEVRHGVECIQAATEMDALNIGQQFARWKLPLKDGWTNHQVTTCAMSTVLKPPDQWK